MRRLTSLAVACTTAAAVTIAAPAAVPNVAPVAAAATAPQSSKEEATTPVIVIVSVLGAVILADLAFQAINKDQYRTLFTQSSMPR